MNKYKVNIPVALLIESESPSAALSEAEDWINLVQTVIAHDSAEFLDWDYPYVEGEWSDIWQRVIDDDA